MMKRINEMISEGMHKFLVNKKSAGIADNMHEGDFICKVSHSSGYQMSYACDAWHNSEDSLTVHLKYRNDGIKDHGQILFVVISEDGKDKFYCDAVRSVESKFDNKLGKHAVTFRFAEGAYTVKESAQGFLVNQKSKHLDDIVDGDYLEFIFKDGSFKVLYDDLTVENKYLYLYIKNDHFSSNWDDIIQWVNEGKKPECDVYKDGKIVGICWGVHTISKYDHNPGHSLAVYSASRKIRKDI